VRNWKILSKLTTPELFSRLLFRRIFSTDATGSIAESYADQGVRLVRADKRKGKEYAQLCAIRASDGEILVFSDVVTQIPAEALRLLASRFVDERVGAVSSEDHFISNDGKVAG
jgi:glycosyltransferase involved in cell wall biosynthesis